LKIENCKIGTGWTRTGRVKPFAKAFPLYRQGPVKRKKLEAAAHEICRELETLDTTTIPFAETNRILDFARID
jgi:hypothetical protein